MIDRTPREVIEREEAQEAEEAQDEVTRRRRRRIALRLVVQYEFQALCCGGDLEAGMVLEVGMIDEEYPPIALVTAWVGAEHRGDHRVLVEHLRSRCYPEDRGLTVGEVIGEAVALGRVGRGTLGRRELAGLGRGDWAPPARPRPPERVSMGAEIRRRRDDKLAAERAELGRFLARVRTHRRNGESEYYITRNPFVEPVAVVVGDAARRAVEAEFERVDRQTEIWLAAAAGGPTPKRFSNHRRPEFRPVEGG